MITQAECKTHLAKCQALGTDPTISQRKATAIMAICHALLSLEQVVIRFDAVVKDEAR